MSIRLTKVEAVPRIREYNKSKHVFEEFIKSGAKAVVISYDEGEYVTSKSLYNMLIKAAKRHSQPIQVIMRDNSVYLIRTDM